MHARNRIGNALFIVQYSRRELLRISPLRLTNTIVHCAPRVIVFHALIIYFHALFLSPISEVTLPPFSLPKSTSPNPSHRNAIYFLAPLSPIIEVHSIDATALHLLGKYNELPSSFIIFLLSAICSTRSRFRGS